MQHPAIILGGFLSHLLWYRAINNRWNVAALQMNLPLCLLISDSRRAFTNAGLQVVHTAGRVTSPCSSDVIWCWKQRTQLEKSCGHWPLLTEDWFHRPERSSSADRPYYHRKCLMLLVHRNILITAILLINYEICRHTHVSTFPFFKKIFLTAVGEDLWGGGFCDDIIARGDLLIHSRENDSYILFPLSYKCPSYQYETLS